MKQYSFYKLEPVGLKNKGQLFCDFRESAKYRFSTPNILKFLND